MKNPKVIKVWNEEKGKYEYWNTAFIMLMQKLAGIAFLIISFIFWRMMRGTGEDAGALLITVPMGLYCLLHRKPDLFFFTMNRKEK